jgi:hypothetical protein
MSAVEMIDVKVADLKAGAALDWIVSHATGAWSWAHNLYPTMTLDPKFKGVSDSADSGGCIWLVPNNHMRQDPHSYSPSKWWFHGGDFIDRYSPSITPVMGGAWEAECDKPGSGGDDIDTVIMPGATALEAACKAIAASILGKTVSIPKQLMG